MSLPRASLVVAGQIVVAAEADQLVPADAIGIADGRVVSAGTREEVLAAALSGATLVDHGPRAVVPGLRDFHLHLVGMARARREVALDDAESGAELVDRLRTAAAKLPPDAWLRGRGWRDEVMTAAAAATLDRAIGERPALVYSHDGHSAWASSEALRRAGLDGSAVDPPGDGWSGTRRAICPACCAKPRPTWWSPSPSGWAVRSSCAPLTRQWPSWRHWA